MLRAQLSNFKSLEGPLIIPKMYFKILWGFFWENNLQID